MPRKGESAPWLKKVTTQNRPAGGDVGWGPPKGAGTGGPKRTPAERQAAKKLIPKEVLAERKVKKALRREELLAVYEEIALDTAQPAMARVSAVDKYLDRTEGKAPQANVNFDGGAKTLSDLIAETQKLKEDGPT